MEAAGRPSFGALLRQFRLDAGMTQQQLAERANLSADAISTLERGARTRPYRETIVFLGRALDLSPEREALLARAVGSAHPPRRRSERLNGSLLRVVRPEPQTTAEHNLPFELTSFVGREHEIAEIAALLREHRLVTVVGAGGVGKTRAALQLGRELLDACTDGVWVADLAPLANEALVDGAVAAALRLPANRGSLLESILTFLKTRRLLLILNNCEHVVIPARNVAASIVQACASVHVLATSRRPLEVAGERVYRLPSLSVPPDASPTTRDARSHAAVALFLDRAQAVQSDFALTNGNAAAVSDICRRLDGIPLAIELAASRINVLAPRQIAQRLDQRFRLLARSDPQALLRHQTMTASLDWSYDLLTPREQRFFEALSIFAGGCTLEATTAVCAVDGEDDADVIEIVTSLVTKSLLVAELAGSEQRYRLLESSRQYARNKLLARGEHADIARRHTLCYLDLAERLDAAWETTPDREWLPQAGVLLDNLRAALDWALQKPGDIVLGLRLAALRMMMRRVFPLSEARRWVRAALELVTESSPIQMCARLEHADAAITGQLGEVNQCLAATERALARYRELGDELGVAQVQTLAGGPLVILERFAEAEPLLRESLKAARRLGNRRLAATALRMIAHAQALVGDFDAARATLVEALALAKSAGADLVAAALGVGFSSIEYDAGNVEAALALQTDAVATYRELGLWGLHEVPGNLAGMAMEFIALGRFGEARSSANEALELAHGLGIIGMAAVSLGQLAIVSVLGPQIEPASMHINYAAAARILGFVDASLTSVGVPKKYGVPEYDLALTILRDALGAEDLAKLVTAGAAMSESAAIALAHDSQPGVD